MANKTVTLDDRRLRQLLKAFKGKIPIARVGILGNGKERKGDFESNASIGARHEFGSGDLPMRSFLRMPITDELNNYMEKAGLFNDEVLKKVIAEGSIRRWVTIVGLVGEEVVAEAFATGGFGKWISSNMSKKHNQQTLVETGQLRNSITSDVK